MHAVTQTRSRSATSSCTESRVEATLDVFCGDLAAFICRGILARERANNWLRDLSEVLVLEAVNRFQVKVALPSGRQVALDYEVSDDGQISRADGCGGFASHWIPLNARISLVVDLRATSPNLAEASRLLESRGWGDGDILDAPGAVDRCYSKDGYGFQRRLVGEWQV